MEENIYDFLGLSPKENDEKVKGVLAAEIRKWNNMLIKQPDRAKAKLKILKRLQKDLDANPNMLKEHADNYETLIANKKEEQKKAIREAFRIYVRNGQIEENALSKLANEYSAFTKEEILSIIGATIRERREFRYRETGSCSELDSTLFKNILNDLAKVNKRDLYDFLGVPANALSSSIKQICDEKYKENERRPANDEKKIVNSLISHCKTQLLDVGKRANYDYTCDNQAFAEIRKAIEIIASGKEKIIDPKQYEALLEKCTKKGMSYDKAEFMIYNTAEKHNVTLRS